MSRKPSSADEKQRAALLSLLHWDRLPGLHTTGLAQLQMWALASREGLMKRKPAAPKEPAAPKKLAAKKPTTKGSGARKG